MGELARASYLVEIAVEDVDELVKLAYGTIPVGDLDEPDHELLGRVARAKRRSREEGDGCDE